jgi:glycosyltransferase involved in cell wall biosynthesis
VNWRDRRCARTRPAPELDARALPGTLVAGWHAPEARGRWTSDAAWTRLPDGARAVRVACVAERGRGVRLTEAGGRVVASSESTVEGGPVVLTAELREPLVALRTSNVGVTDEQRRHGDTRRLATFVESIEWSDGGAWHTLDLRQRCFHPPETVELSRDRFVLPLNHSIVRFGDAFIVHSRYIASRIAAERNQLTPVGLVHHGAEERWRDEDRTLTRARLGLPSAWQRGFLVVSFGGVQAHKRVDKLLEAFARARASAPDSYLALVGGVSTGTYDPREHARLLGIADVVHFSGYVPEQVGWDWLHAGDLSVNLRGPTTGGTSGGVFQSFSLGRAVLASDAGEQSELPDDCTVKVPLGDGEVDAIARELVALRRDPARRARLESSVRRFVGAECSWRQCARKYIEYLDRFPPARASRKGLIDLKLGLGARRAAV